MKILKPAPCFLLFTVLVAIAFMGCSKDQTANKLSGRWDRVFVDDASDTARIEQWEFSSGQVFRIYYSDPSVVPGIFVEGTYKMDNAKEFTITGYSEAGFPLYLGGTWRVIKLKKDILIITKKEDPGGLTFREFSKI